jgi:polysaccharide pyruvyl transferase WcaK-like protein
LSRLFIGIAVRLSHYRAFRDPYSLEEGRSLGAPEPNLLVRDLAFSNPLLSRNGHVERHEKPLSIGINPLPFYGGEYWHVLDGSVYDQYVAAHAELAVELLRRGHRVTLFPTNIRVDPRAVRRVYQKVQELAPDVAPRLELEATLQDVPALFERLRGFDLVVATRYHGVLLALACGTPALAVVYHAKTRQVAEHMGVSRWAVDAAGITGARLLERFDDLEPRLAEVRDEVASRRLVDLPSLLQQYERLGSMAGGSAPASATR